MAVAGWPVHQIYGGGHIYTGGRCVGNDTVSASKRCSEYIICNHHQVNLLVQMRAYVDALTCNPHLKYSGISPMFDYVWLVYHHKKLSTQIWPQKANAPDPEADKEFRWVAKSWTFCLSSSQYLKTVRGSISNWSMEWAPGHLLLVALSFMLVYYSSLAFPGSNGHGIFMKRVLVTKFLLPAVVLFVIAVPNGVFMSSTASLRVVSDTLGMIVCGIPIICAIGSTSLTFQNRQ